MTSISKDRRQRSTSTYSYDAENRLTSVSGAAAATFVYDGDGNRVKTTFGSTTTTIYVGAIYERDNGSTVRKYYYAGGVRIAMRTGGQTYYLLSDHLGGTNVTANSSGAQISKLLQIGRIISKNRGRDFRSLRRFVQNELTVHKTSEVFPNDPYQIVEARVAGADALLLIVAVLGDTELRRLLQETRHYGMEALVEVHDQGEVERALKAGARVIGVNNRDLRTFAVDIAATARLRPLIPTEFIMVSESGIHTPADVRRLKELGVDAMLVGESLVTAKPEERLGKVRELVRAG
jgi:YD repeat-containing protein